MKKRDLKFQTKAASQMTETLLNLEDHSVSSGSNSTEQTEEEEQEDGSGSHLQGLQHLETKRVKNEETSDEALISAGGYQVNL